MKTVDENINLLLSGELDEEGKSALAKQLADDSGAAEKLGGLLLTEGLLGVALEDELSVERRRAKLIDALQNADQDDFLSGVKDKIRHHQWRSRLLATAALLVIGVALWTFSRNFSGSEMVASVTRLETLDWGAGTPVSAGESLPSGTRLRFDSGLIELKMGDRGRMIVEGPVDLELVEPMRSILHQGRVLMRVTEAGHGYQLETSRGSIIDLGTEFGVSVNEHQSVETHVFDGEVEAIPSGGGKVLLGKSDGLRFGNAGSERIKADGGEFYTALPPKRAKKPNFVHWPLEAEAMDDPSDKAMVRGFGTENYDMALRKMDQGDLPTRTNGVFGGALSFDGQGAFAESSFPGIGGKEPRTVSFWVKVPADFNHRQGFALVSWGMFQGSDFGGVWQISINPMEQDGPPGRLRVGTHGGQIIGTTDLRDDEWHHVAVVLYESSHEDVGKQVLIYLNGRIEPASRRALQEVNTRIDGANHGVWLGRNVTYTESLSSHQFGGFFRGMLDEVYIFDCALNQQEILELMRKNHPPE